jgi:type VI secretion system secreted protein Hcp
MANDMYLKVDGAPGESKDSKHKDWIEIDSYSFGASQMSTMGHGGGGGAGKVQMQDFHFVSKLDKASPVLFQFLASGKHIGKVELSQCKVGGDQVEFLKVTMEDALMSSWQMGDSAGGAIPTGQYSFSFSKIKVEYSEQTDKGGKGATTTGGWDNKGNTKM